MQGKILKGVGGFYYVHLHSCNQDKKIYECKAKGIFRNQKIKPLVGDDVCMDVISEEELIGNITEICERKNELIRPAVANVDQAMVIFALMHPTPNFNLLDRFLLMMERQSVKSIICFNKTDLIEDKEAEEIAAIYRDSGYEVFLTSTQENAGIDKVWQKLMGKTTVLAGPSGVGKSSLLNALMPEANAQTGSVSEKIKRGRHTTRHSELMYLGEDTFLMDTPGFSSLYIEDMEPEEIKEYYDEFIPYREKCRFNGCNHINEPDCGVKTALSEGKISELRYKNYVQLYQEQKDKRRW